jgi:hypothetical protein
MQEAGVSLYVTFFDRIPQGHERRFDLFGLVGRFGLSPGGSHQCGGQQQN